MTYSQDTLNEIEEMATNLTKISDIAIILDIDENDLRRDIADPKSDASRAYRKGKAKCLYEIRRNEIEQAEAGSHESAASVIRYTKQMEDDEQL